eukprot:594853-Pleurochrysis_carterae.AAC.3
MTQNTGWANRAEREKSTSMPCRPATGAGTDSRHLNRSWRPALTCQAFEHVLHFGVSMRLSNKPTPI